MAHIKMFTPADVEKPDVRALIEQATKRPDLGTPARPLKTVVTIVKARRTEAKPAWPRLF